MTNGNINCYWKANDIGEENSLIYAYGGDVEIGVVEHLFILVHITLMR